MGPWVGIGLVIVAALLAIYGGIRERRVAPNVVDRPVAPRDAPVWAYIVLGLTCLIIIFGFAANSGVVGMFIGGAAGAAEDPLVLVSAIVVAIPRKWWLSVLLIVGCGVAIDLLIQASGDPLLEFGATEQRWRYLINRWWAIAFVGALFAMAAWLVQRLSSQAPLPPKR